MGEISYPKGHRPGTKVPRGGSSCASCKWVRPRDDGSGMANCASQYFQEWAGTNEIPVVPDSYCSDWWEPVEDTISDPEPGSVHEAFARHLRRGRVL